MIRLYASTLEGLANRIRELIEARPEAAQWDWVGVRHIGLFAPDTPGPHQISIHPYEEPQL